MSGITNRLFICKNMRCRDIFNGIILRLKLGFSKIPQTKFCSVHLRSLPNYRSSFCKSSLFLHIFFLSLAFKTHQLLNGYEDQTLFNQHPNLVDRHSSTSNTMHNLTRTTTNFYSSTRYTSLCGIINVNFMI